jgi:hypothetical protein
MGVNHLLSIGAVFFLTLIRSAAFRIASKLHMSSGSITTHPKFAEYSEYIKSTAAIDVPKRLNSLLNLLEFKGEQILSPKDRKGMIPFLIPISKKPGDDSTLCYIRWPTQKADMDLQLVRTTPTGVRLVAMGSTSFCRRLVAEMDFYSVPSSEKAMDILNSEGPLYERGEFLPMLRSGKFPAITEEDLALILDRYLLTKVGPFPDCYERIAENYIKKNDVVSALVTCERALTIFYGWGHPVKHFASMLARSPGRGEKYILVHVVYHEVDFRIKPYTITRYCYSELEARDTARTSLGMPIWTLADTEKELNELATMAGFSGSAILGSKNITSISTTNDVDRASEFVRLRTIGEMHMYRANDPRKDDIGEGLSPAQVILDQAAHLMDAIAFGIRRFVSTFDIIYIKCMQFSLI